MKEREGRTDGCSSVLFPLQAHARTGARESEGEKEVEEGDAEERELEEVKNVEKEKEEKRAWRCYSPRDGIFFCRDGERRERERERTPLSPPFFLFFPYYFFSFFFSLFFVLSIYFPK